MGARYLGQRVVRPEGWISTLHADHPLDVWGVKGRAMTTSNARGRTSTIFAIQADFAQLIIVAILLALGANVLAAGLAGLLAPSRAGLILLGVLLIVVGLVMAFWRIRPSINGVSDLEGVIFLTKNRQPVAVKRYRFSGALENYVNGLITENKALGRIWNENDFFTWPEKIKNSEFIVTASKSKDLAVEAIEYFSLERLSTHLTDYFNQDDSVDHNRIVTLLRKDVPELFLQNRFLDLFSDPWKSASYSGNTFQKISRHRRRSWQPIVRALGLTALILRYLREPKSSAKLTENFVSKQTVSP
jgi:hypothetical protein